MRSVWPPAPPGPPKTVLSVVDLDSRHVGTGLPVPALGGHAGGGELDEVLGHAAREDGRRAQPGRHVVAHDVQRDLVVTNEVFLPFDKLEPRVRLKYD